MWNESFFRAPQLKRDPLGSVEMSNDTYSFGQRVFRAFFMALVGGAVGLLLALVLIRSGWIRNWNPISLFASVGTGLGALTGFLFNDFAWKRALRLLLPFSNWP